MFGTKPNSSGIFGNSTSTPTSTPGPAQPSLGNPLLSQKPNGLFNNVNNTNTLGTSTPSPSTGLFGNKTATAPGTSGGLFGGVTNTNTSLNQNKPTGLFGNSTTTTTTAAPSGGLFGNSATNAASSAPTTGLFGNGNTQTNSGGLFGNTASTNSTLGNSTGTSLFGNSTSNALNNNTTSGSLFGNKPTIGGNTISGGLFSNNATAQPAPIQSQTNPYGLNVRNTAVNVSTMPAPIIKTLKKDKKEEVKTEPTRKNSVPKRSFSISSASNLPAPVTDVPYSNLFQKLNTRLNTAKNISSTKGIFSQSWNSQDFLNGNNLSKKKNASVKDLAAMANGSGNVQELRRLKIDTARSAAKKMKLLNGISLVTKLNKDDTTSTSTRESTPTVSSMNNNKEKDEILEKSENGLSNNIQPEDPDTNQMVTRSFVTTAPLSLEDAPKDQDIEYWCSPSIESLSKLTSTQLKAVPNFIIGRKGFGNISFNYDVDLSDFAPDFSEELFGKTVSFYSTKTVEVYPDHGNKPAIGFGLNVPATISLEKIFPVDKKTKRPITDASKTDEMQVLIRKLKGMRDMEFISYNPFGGIWTFKVNHFSIWGLVNESDVEIDESDIDSYKNQNENPIYTSNNIQGNNRPLISVASGNIHDDDFSMVNSDPILNEDIIEEKQYEPDVIEQDFDLLQVEPDLKTSDNWVDQLQLAGSNDNTVFVKEFNSKTVPEKINDIFNSFDRDHRADKEMIKHMKLKTSINFATILHNDSLLLKSRHSSSGVSLYTPKSELGDKFNIQRELFQKHIASSVIEKRQGSELPCITKFGLQFKDILQVIPSDDSLRDVWELCSVLFDDIILQIEVESEEVEKVLLKQKRYDNLCLWLSKKMQCIVNTKNIDKSDPLDEVFYTLLQNDVITAAKLAILSKNKHLAVLISYLGSNDPRIRELSSLQLSTWKSNNQTIDPKVKIIYQLLSGDLFEDDLEISALTNKFGWLSVLSLSVFYGQVDELSLERLVSAQLFALPRTDELLISGILELFTKETDINCLLKKISVSSANNQANIQFMWYLTHILVFKNHLDVSKLLRDQISSLYIDQLKLLGCSLESIYVALFINNNEHAEHIINSILHHTIPDIWNDAIERSIILEKLQLPKGNVYGSLSLREKYNGNYVGEAEYLLLGELFNEVIELICKEVGPRLILSYNQCENVEYLNILSGFIKRIPTDQRASYEKELSIFTDFISLVSSRDTNEIPDDKQIFILEDNIKTYYENNKHYKTIPACCNIISKRIQYIKKD